MKKTKRNEEGLIIIDHSNSPGNIIAPAGTVFESATVRCAHCHALIILNPNRTRPRGYCSKCGDYYCDKPECNPILFQCQNLDSVLDDLQEQAFQNLNIKEL